MEANNRETQAIARESQREQTLMHEVIKARGLVERKYEPKYKPLSPVGSGAGGKEGEGAKRRNRELKRWDLGRPLRFDLFGRSTV